MISLRTLLTATAASPFAATAFQPEARAATPRDLVVVAQQIDDIIS